MNVWLARSPENLNAGDDLDYIIAELPGWLSADDSVRKRIVAGAVPYLANAESEVDLWLRRQPLPLHRIDLAALRAFLLLHQEDSETYAALPASIWRKWAKVIVGLPRRGVVDKCANDRPPEAICSAEAICSGVAMAI